MPFTIRFLTCNPPPAAEGHGGPAPQPTSADQGMTAREKTAVLQRVILGGGNGPNAQEQYRLEFTGGRAAVLTFPNLRSAARCTNAELTTEEPFRDLVALAFELAQLGNLMFFADGVSRPMVPTEQMWVRVLKRWPSAIVVPSVERLWAMIGPPEPEPAAEESTGEAPAGEESPAEPVSPE